MKDLLEKLYSGEIYPAEQLVIADPAYKPTHKRIDNEIAYLRSQLPNEAWPHLDELESLYLNSSSMTCFAGFASGFKLGVQLMHEVFTKEKQPY